MTLKQLRAFLEAVRTGSFTAAAARMDITQASVSELIRKLEDEHGTPVFSRGGRRLVLTAAGSALLPFAEQAVAAADGAEQALRSVRSLRGGVATFGLLRNAAYYLLSDLAQQFHDSYPEVRIRLIGLNSVEVASAVAAGTVEAGLVVLPIDDDGLDVTPLMRDEVVYASADPARVAEPVTTAGLGRSRLILYDAHYGWADPTRRQLAERAQLAGIRLEPWIEVEHVESALALVARGIGDTIISRAVAESATCPDSVHTVGFAEPLYDTIALVRRKAEVLSPASRELARLAQRMLLSRS
ncbi:LysR family transcriptional regulator [Prauserella rugosa]|uniref:DNA-binding transcriptional LysR family regulator n=1 Tax=Prauserella rugosa TaxID=43354 RepID=A0A660C6C0_9PSEU|nr:LysR family transcriptional regulator [Prauserella rugosa]KMS65990.1 LysR family transcriptional regulator [Streptomyces regensis]TWH18886.1 DNA-binding transcriptional LysR family regulator [Prauserella rugosa]